MIKTIRRSLTNLLGEGYISHVCAARAALTGEAPEEELMARLGQALVPAFENGLDGAPTGSYQAAQHSFAAPLGGLGCFRIGEDGRLYFAGKSEHYHIPLGHDFPGYRLIENAKKLGIPNATHNNTRGFVTRTLERRLIAAANGMDPGDASLDALLAKKEPGVLNTVINLETGSLAVEAAPAASPPATTAPPCWPRPCGGCGPALPKRRRRRSFTRWCRCPSTTPPPSRPPPGNTTPALTRPRASATRSS